MGKRSNFERREADFYPTPRAAVVPLIPHLRGIHTFAEPCAGDGDLVRHLESFGLSCVWQSDLRSGQDALGLAHYGPADAIITSPTWLLLESDWAQTKQAAPFIRQGQPRLVPIRREAYGRPRIPLPQLWRHDSRTAQSVQTMR
jgi:hypothetical protein